MNQKSRSRHLRSLLALSLAAALQGQAHAADLNQRLDVNTDPRQLVYGEAMYDYYLGNGFTALNDLLLAKANNVLTDNDPDSEVFIGDRYTEFGLPAQADAIFSKAITRDTLSTTRNTTWFRKGKLLYRLGNYAEAEKILSANQDNLTGELDYERRVMLANVLIQQGEYTSARHVLEPVPLTTMLGAYASYNMGVAYLRANRSHDGVRLLESVMNLPVADTETNALKDRAALAIGYNYLQQKQPDRARDALVNIRLDGPFSTQAMLALGYAHYERQDYKKALSLWLELLPRNQADPSVQEAMLLAPRAYEELKADQQALYGYGLASKIYRSQLKSLEKAGEALEQPNWLEELSPSADAGLGADPLAVVDTTTASSNQETPFLFQLFATNQFNEAYKQYEQLKRLQQLLAIRAGELQGLRDVAGNMQRLNGQHLASASTTLTQKEATYAALQQRWQRLQERARDAGRNAEDFADTASVQDVELNRKLEAMESSLSKLPDTPANRELRSRFERVKGLSLWGIASNAPMSQEDLYQSLQDTDQEMQALQVRLQAVRALIADNRKALGNQSDARISQLSARVTQAQADVAKSLDEHRNYLRQLARNVLAESKARLNNGLAEAYLSVARLQDQAINADEKQASREVTKP